LRKNTKATSKASLTTLNMKPGKTVSFLKKVPTGCRREGTRHLLILNEPSLVPILNLMPCRIIRLLWSPYWGVLVRGCRGKGAGPGSGQGKQFLGGKRIKSRFGNHFLAFQTHGKFDDLREDRRAFCMGRLVHIEI
jgi:hypothetical protein